MIYGKTLIWLLSLPPVRHWIFHLSQTNQEYTIGPMSKTIIINKDKCVGMWLLFYKILEKLYKVTYKMAAISALKMAKLKAIFVK